jgi:hypothetical protein
MRLFVLLAWMLVLFLPSATSRAQMQPGGPTLGSPGPPENPADVRKKTAICNKAANQYKLRGDDRKKYLSQCMAVRYSPDFKPPTWPLT